MDAEACFVKQLIDCG